MSTSSDGSSAGAPPPNAGSGVPEDDGLQYYKSGRGAKFHQLCLSKPLSDLSEFGLDAADIQAVKELREMLEQPDLSEDARAYAMLTHDRFVAGPIARRMDDEEAAAQVKRNQVDLISKGSDPKRCCSVVAAATGFTTTWCASASWPACPA